MIGKGSGKYHDLSVASRPLIGLSRRIDLRDAGKSRYFATIKFNNCFINQSPGLFESNDALYLLHLYLTLPRDVSMYCHLFCHIFFVDVVPD